MSSKKLDEQTFKHLQRVLNTVGNSQLQAGESCDQAVSLCNLPLEMKMDILGSMFGTPQFMCSVDSGRAPALVHPGLGMAKTECLRLARMNENSNTNVRLLLQLDMLAPVHTHKWVNDVTNRTPA